MSDRKHGEAFALMLYQGQTSGRTVTIWNSRDGVTPFMVDIDGEIYQHVHWELDTPAPQHTLRPGDYYFRDTSQEDAVKAATMVVDLRWPKLTGNKRARRIDELVPQMLTQGGSPTPWLDRQAAKDGAH